ncbi:hypothetical protein J4411_02205 [Candidatus Pacearchaeota archaeon]|nr:hypothetical protein [Candidatus Pacearchaeota archaeon]OGM74190.1 MAG: hypothetical protein A2191_04010 [Candidatus Woesebacteria bacterium RIFOXYA1_FULL_38_9]
MSEKDEIYSSKISYDGIFNFREFYTFCHNWLTEESGLEVVETEYSEKIAGPAKEIKFKWTATKDVTDYFRFEIKIGFSVRPLTEIEVNQGGEKVKTNKGKIEIKVTANLERDYDGKFETSGKMKIWRGIYEKWIISQRVAEFEDKLSGMSDEFLGQAKSFLALEGKYRQ